MTKVTSNDFLPDVMGFGTVAGHVRAKAAIDTGDAELYRIVVAHSLREGRFQTKAEFDAEVRSIGTVDQADQIIAFRNLRPGCKASRYGDRMVCECTATWKLDVVGLLPHCRQLPK